MEKIDLNTIKERFEIEKRALIAIKNKEKLNDPQINSLIKVCSYGILVRQSVEYLVNFKLSKINIGGLNFNDKYGVKDLSEKINIFEEDNNCKKYIAPTEIEVFNRTREYANKIAHIRYFKYFKKDYDEFKKRYPRPDGHGTRSGHELLNQYIDKLVKDNPYDNNAYLRALRQNIEYFNTENVFESLYDVKNQLTYTLTIGLLTRHCLEYVIEIAIREKLEYYPLSIDGKRATLFDKIKAFDNNFETSDLHNIRMTTNDIIHISSFDVLNSYNYSKQASQELSVAYEILMHVNKHGLQAKPKNECRDRPRNNYNTVNASFTEKKSKKRSLRSSTVWILLLIGVVAAYIIYQVMQRI